MESLKHEKEMVFEKCKCALLNDKNVILQWLELCNRQIEQELGNQVLEQILKRYLMVSHKQFLKDIKSNLNVERKKRHREQVQTKSINSKNTEAISIDFIINDKTANKEGSHLRLRIKCLENEHYFNSKEYTKNDITKLCEAYGVNYSKSQKKEKLASTLRQQILITDKMCNTEIFSENTASTSEEPTSKEPTKKKPKRGKIPSKGKGKGKGKSKKKTYFCGTCEVEYKEDEDWIECDGCREWFHRACVNLENDEDWQKVQDPDVEWNCPQCK